jgi:sec-independent protein translocase protein TatA
MITLSIAPILLSWVPSGGELMVLLLIIVVLFGGKKIPELAKGLGSGIREFNEAKDGIKSEIESGIKDKDKAGARGSGNNQGS